MIAAGAAEEPNELGSVREMLRKDAEPQPAPPKARSTIARQQWPRAAFRKPGTTTGHR